MEVGSIIQFGKYPQGAEGEVWPIEWFVLATYQNRALIISKHVLDAQQYNTELADTTWATSSIRNWLHLNFLPAAFSEEEQKRILTTNTPNNDNPRYWTPGGVPSKDRIHLLSGQEVEKYFAKEPGRRVLATGYAARKGLRRDAGGSCCWCTRTPGASASSVTNVYYNGALSYNGDKVSNLYAIRPALWITF